MQGEENKAWQDVELKIKPESDELEPKQEVEAEAEDEKEIKTEVDESKSVMDDIDKFEPIESDEDEEMCGNLETSIEIDENQDKSMEDDCFKQEPITDDSKSQDDIELTATIASKEPDNEDFDIPSTQSENISNETETESLISSVLPENEIEDIQQKLHSFHSENLMILQTRNKKRASRATTPTSDEVSNSSVAPKDSVPSTSGCETDSKISKISTDDREYKREPSNKSQNEDESSFVSYQPTNAPIQTPTIPAQSISQATHPYSSYALNSARIESNQSIPPAQIYQNVAPPGFVNVNSPHTPNMSSSSTTSSSTLYQYLEHQNRTPGYNAGYNASHMFSIHTNVPPPTLLNSSNYLTKSYSTLSEPTTPVSNIPPLTASTTPSASNNPINPKVLSRTQSADPRLNPPKDLPPITPKRKLSINEYRKRKQLTTTSEKPKVDNVEKIESLTDSNPTTPIEDKPKNGVAVDTTKDTGKYFFS